MIDTIKHLTVLKLGGSCITDKTQPYTPDTLCIQNIARQIKKNKQPLLIAHGSGSFGHTSAKKYGGKKGYLHRYGIAKVAHDAMQINAIVMSIFLEEKVPAISVRPLSMMHTQEGKVKEHVFSIIEDLLAQNLIPVLYGDVIIDRSWKTTIYSGEQTLFEIILYLLERKFQINKVIYAGNTDGVYDEAMEVIPHITEKDWQKLQHCIFKNEQNDITGGMDHKIEQALLLAKKEIPTWIINGKRPQAIQNALVNRFEYATEIR